MITFERNHIRSCSFYSQILPEEEKNTLLPHYAARYYDQNLQKIIQQNMIIVFKMQFLFCQTLNAIQTDSKESFQKQSI